MRYEDARRLRGVESAWLRLKLWLGSILPRSHARIGDVIYLSERDRRDIGLPEQSRCLDWRKLQDERFF